MPSRPAAIGDLRVELDRIWHRHTRKSLLLGEESAPLDAAGRILLRAAAGNGPLRSSALADLCFMSRPAVSRRVAALVQAGLIESIPDPDDGRATLLTPTTAGHEALADLETTGAAAVDVVASDFDDTELLVLTSLLRRLNDRADGSLSPASTQKETFSA